ncbi:GNAT family N-acetyltransferase [Psychroflexus sp. YR1-1]|uniref:GNAT family N-acetyltransferase n=1 Tax=Psychroflexus aurantiacus TaxID=2709310 RepID=A0A6B3QXZ1_9FLAO|nr:GNAT family N-acetyltransferase [Psychroflexus aurantiacus]NEV92969.1 GNAT family N-acetyltransferase [Psychroflexus aurantiacus]
MQLTFTLIHKEDLEDVISLFQAAADKISRMNIDHWQYWKNPPSEKIEWVKEGIQNKEYFFVQNENNETLGMVRILDQDLLYWGKQDEKARYIHSLLVKEEYNGKGIGIQIIKRIGRDAKAMDCKYLRLDADSTNPKLCRYYENQGFKQVGAKKLPISTYNLYEKALA